MNIIVTEEAKKFFNENHKPDQAIRIVARDTYECSTMIEFYLERSKFIPGEDQQEEIAGQPFVYNKKASDEIGSQVTIDYKSSQGLKLINKNQTLAYGLLLK
ncbi:iron-sulfur cluster biosynthesis family protein [Alkalicoccobacillus murimartini]|uniref:Core domain-containing protein n=1 Tax=Alkalicoccobacillus murimartini TaxID=171685 RepID=A0ABT9YED3_9BACI|nr:iron-sulfur cluster biosynthesis family protein [Alkalicoccobacillus murimartini]MDQ0206213.1 hypothetical protein [Alkalicoccobacillus murimartini]